MEFSYFKILNKCLGKAKANEAILDYLSLSDEHLDNIARQIMLDDEVLTEEDLLKQI